MTDENNYLDIMIESLQKKEKILDNLIAKCEAQAEVIANNEYGDIAWDKFNVLIVEKDALIDRLNDSDEGFQALYDRISEDLKANKDRYADKIRMIQDLIRTVTDKGVTIKAKEERNRADLERVLTGAKKEIGGQRKSLSAASNYYNTMAGAFATEIPSQLDQKK
ncbi:MAG: hypothetical protein K6G22_04510 [Lachnospiraceae bacterium]|nr:hypothetical protein [Lachnospiraceae bacterium]